MKRKWIVLALSLAMLLAAQTALAVDLSWARVGTTITFGSYEQDGNYYNGVEPIEWLVLDRSQNGLLVISAYALDRQPFHWDDAAVTWASSDLRRWLNSTFLSQAFTAAEERQIQSSWVRAESVSYYNTSPGYDTQDKVFLLSYDEVTRYMRPEGMRVTTLTRAAKSGLDSDANQYRGNCWWWIRNPGKDINSACHINAQGELRYIMVNNRVGGVRPAMWLSIN